MAATERRVSSSRRGMTVLGKVPVVPKPMNLPSQRLENRGLFSDVDIVPRGTCSWGSMRLFPGASGSKSRKSDAASLTPSKSGGECDNGGKVESKPISSTSAMNLGVKDGRGLPGNSIQFSIAKATTGQALDKNGKIEEPIISKSCSRSSLDNQKQETTAPPLPKNGDGYIQGVSGPPGFLHSGPQGNQSRAGVFGPDLQSNGVGAGVYPNVTQQDGLPSFTGAPHHNGTKEREIIVIHMVGSPAFYGNYPPPQLGYPHIYNKNGSYENFPLQFGNFEPYLGFQGHGRLDGRAQISSVSGSDLYTGHEDFVCYEKECYQGRKKNGLVRGNFQESSFPGGAQGEVHEARTLRSSLRPSCLSEKHLSRNAGRLKSSYHNGRLVSIEDASAVPVPEKRITLLTKLSAPKLLSLDESGVGEFEHAEYVVGSALLACGDEGKAPETFEVDLVAEDGQDEKTVTSAGLKVTNEDRLIKEPELECKEVSVLTTTCNDTCLHCKAAALEGPALKVCQACKKKSVFESASAEVSSESICRSNSTDGCTVEVKHVIFDADSSSSSAVKGRENVSLRSLIEVTDNHKQLGNTTLKKKLSARISPEEKVKQRLLGKKGVKDGNWKPKRPVGAAKVDIKVFAPKMRKAAGRKNTSKTLLVNDCVSEASSSATTRNEHPMGDISADSIKLSSETETCNKQLELLLPSSLASSGDVPDDASQASAKEKPKDAASVDCIASEGRVKKRRGKNTCKATLPKDYHDNTATVDDAESLVKTVFEDISNTEVQKQESKDADSTKEKAWRPKGPTASQCKSATKVSGILVDVVPKILERQERKLHLFYGSTSSADSSEVDKEELSAAQKSNSLSTSQYCDSETLQPNKSLSFEARSTNNARGQQSLVFRKRSAEQAALGHQSSRDASSNKEPIGSRAISSKFGPEHPKQSFDSTSPCESSLADMNCSVSASKYHMVRRRVYHVVEGSGGDYSIPSATFSGKPQLAGKYRCLQTTSLQNQAEFRKKTVNLPSGSSYTESEHSEEFSDSMCMVEIMSCGFQNKGMCHSGLAANQLPSTSGIEKSKAKKHARPGEQVSAWKPKATPLSGLLQNFIQKKDNNKSGESISKYTEGELKEIKDSDSLSQVSASSHLAGGENCKEQTIKNVCGLPLESESVCYEPLEEIDHAVNAEYSLPRIGSEDVMNSQQKSDIVVSKEDVEHTTVPKHVEEVLKAELGSASCEETVLQQSMQACSEENPASNCRLPFKKKNAISHEKADRYHQMMFKKYKETGHWKPKASRNNRGASNRASRNVSEAPMQDVLVLA